MSASDHKGALGALLVHGAMHGAWSWERVTPHLDEAGVPWHAFDRWTPTSPRFIISDEAENEALIRRHIDLAPFERSVVVCHSAAGIAATMAGADNPKIAHIIYLAAFMTGGGIAPALEEDLVAALRVHEGGEVSVDPTKTAELYYHDCDPADATAALSVGIGDEVECVESVEPPGSLIHVAYCPGLRHPHDRGASGQAVTASLPGDPTSAESARIRRVGFMASTGELQSGAYGVAAPVYGTPMGASLAVIGLDDSVMSAATTRPLVEAAAALTQVLTDRATDATP